MSDADATQARRDVAADVDEIIEHVINANMLSMPYDVYSELFDAVDGLGAEIENLQSENAKLRELCEKRKREYEWLRARMDEFAESYKRMQENNGRLYELVLYMWDFSCVAPDEPHTSKEELDYSVEVWRRMRELGVEV